MSRRLIGGRGALAAPVWWRPFASGEPTGPVRGVTAGPPAGGPGNAPTGEAAANVPSVGHIDGPPVPTSQVAGGPGAASTADLGRILRRGAPRDRDD